MELVFIEGESKPVLMYTPYVHTKIDEYSTFYMIKSNNLLRLVRKESIEEKRKGNKKLGGKKKK